MLASSFVHPDSLMPLRGASRPDSLPLALEVAQLGLFMFLRSLAHTGLFLLVMAAAKSEANAFALDFVSPDPFLSLRGLSRPELASPVLDFAPLGFSLLLRGFARLGFLLLALEAVALDLSMSLRGCACIDFAALVSGFAHLGLFLLLRGAS